jgi:hypothetical protein
MKKRIRILKCRATECLVILILALSSTGLFAQAPYADFVFTPSNPTVEVGETFTLTVRVNTDDDVSVAEVHLLFNPTYLQVQSLTPGGVLNTVLINDFDNNPSTGTIDFAAFANPNVNPVVIPESDFDLVQIELMAMAEISSTTITHNLTDFPVSVIAFGGQNVLNTANDASITITCLNPPVISNCPDNIGPISAIAGTCGAPVTWNDPTANDNCDGPITVVRTDGTGFESGDVFPVGTTTISYSATDSDGDISTCSFTVTVVDNEAPDITTCPSDDNVDADANCEALLSDYTGDVVAADNCDDVLTVTQSPVAGSTLSLGPNLITITVTDDAGLTDECSFTVTVNDVTAPVFSGLPSQTLAVACDAVPAVAAVSATDNCTPGIVVNFNEVQTPGSCPGNYTIERTWSAVDAAGNSTSFTQTITVTDTEDPQITGALPTITLDGCPAILPTAESTVAGLEALGSASNLNISDGCTSDLDLSVSHVDVSVGDCPSIVITRTYTITDLCDNSTTIDQIFQVESVSISGTINLTGDCTDADMRVEVIDNSGGTPVVVETYVASIVNGSYSVDLIGVVPGSYDIRLKPERYLSVLYQNVLIEESTPLAPIVGLRSGDIAGGSDAFQDNIIDNLDISLIIIPGVYNSEPGFPGGIPALEDLNCDGVIDPLDLSLLIFNFNFVGE